MVSYTPSEKAGVIENDVNFNKYLGGGRFKIVKGVLRSMRTLGGCSREKVDVIVSSIGELLPHHLGS